MNLMINKTSLKESKLHYYRYISKHAEDFNNAKFVYNDL